MIFTPRYSSVLRRPNTPFWYMRYRDPNGGKEMLRSTKCTSYAEALGVVRRWAKDLAASVVNPDLNALDRHLEFIELAIPELSPLQRAIVAGAARAIDGAN